MRKSLISMIKTASKKEDERDIAEEFKNDWVYCNENSEKSHPASKTLSPSSMQCQRMMSCKLLSVPKSEVKSNFSLNMICEIGSCIHAYTQKHCLDLKKFTYVNVADYVKEKNLPLSTEIDENIRRINITENNEAREGYKIQNGSEINSNSNESILVYPTKLLIVG